MKCKRTGAASGAEHGRESVRQHAVSVIGHPVATVEESQVRVVSYDSEWTLLYESEVQRLQGILSGIAVEVQHFGSTAVPGLDAKPNVDILVGVPTGISLTTEQIDALIQHGYEFLGEDSRRPGRVFFRKRGGASFNLSVVPFGGDLWKDNLAIRDYLRTHAEEARLYARVKHEVAAESPESLLGYQNRKRDFVEKLRRGHEYGRRRVTVKCVPRVLMNLRTVLSRTVKFDWKLSTPQGILRLYTDESGWKPEPRLWAFRLPDPPSEPSLEAFRPFGLGQVSIQREARLTVCPG